MTGGRAPRIFISAGEPSGDLHAAAVVRTLRERFPEAAIDAVGGPRMAAAGATIIVPTAQLGAIGFAEIVLRVPAHYRLLRRLGRKFRARPYDLVIVVDYPGFHLKLAEVAKRTRTPVLYYIAPKLWASRAGRAKQLAAVTDMVALILPFEATFFQRVGVRSRYVGHPLLDAAPPPSRVEARARLGIPAADRVLGIFPGSRTQEIRRHWPLFRRVALRMLNESRCDRAIVAGTTIDEYPDAAPILIARDDPALVFAVSDTAIAKSGTTTLEAALAGIPMVVVYLTNALTYWLASRLMTVEWISLVNLVAEREVVPELWRPPISDEVLAQQLRPLLDPTRQEGNLQRAGFEEVRARLGQPGAARRVAALASELLEG